MGLEILKATVANIIVAFSAFGFGCWIPRALPKTFSSLTQCICSWVGGFGVLGLTLFVIGHLSFTRATIGIVLAMGVLAGFATIPRSWRFKVPLALPAFAIVAIVLAITAIAGLAEPVGDWGTDGIAYHYVGPKVWLRNGIVRPVADNAPTSYPSTVEMVFASMMAFGGQRAPGLSAAWTLAMFLATAALLSRRLGLDVAGAWWVSALLAAMPALYEGSHSGFVDAIYGAFILVAIRIGLDAKETKHFLLFGFFCGLAMATKYPALATFPFLLLCVAWPRKNEKLFPALLNVILAAATACLVASPIYLANFILLGSPIYPPPAGAANLLHVKYFTPVALHEFYAWSIRRGNGHGRALWHFFTLPFSLTYHTADFHGAGGIGLAPLALGPLGLLSSWQDSFARRLAMTGVLLILLWFLTLQESRYLIHFYAIAAIFAVVGWKYSRSFLGGLGKILSATVVVISISYGLIMIARSRTSDLHAVFSPVFAEHRRYTQIPFLESFDSLNHDSSVTSVLFLDPSVPAYFSDKDYVKPFGQWGEQVFPNLSTPADVLSHLDELHVSHILDVQSTISGFRVPPNLPAMILVFERPGQRIYKVVSTQ